MRCLRLIVPLLILAAVLVLPAANRTVHSVLQQEADQANRAATTDATWTPGSVDLEGVETTDDTTFSFFREKEPTGEGLASVTESCAQPPISEAPAFGFDGVTNGLSSRVNHQPNVLNQSRAILRTIRRSSTKSKLSRTDWARCTTIGHVGPVTRTPSLARSANSWSCAPATQ